MWGVSVLVASVSASRVAVHDFTTGVKGPIKFTKVGGTSGVAGTTEYCLDVHGSVAEGAKVKAKACHGGDDQLWMYSMNGEGRIQVGSGKFLCLTQSAKAEETNLDQMYLSACVPNEKLQVWSFNNHPNKKTGQMRRMKNAGSGKCMGLRYATKHNGGMAVTEWSCGKAVGQALQMCNDMEKPGCQKASLLEMVSKKVQGVKGPIKFTKVGGTSGIGGTTEYCLDVHGTVKEGANMKAKKCHGGDDQLWRFDMNGEGRIQVGSGKLLCLTQREKAQEDNLGQLYLSACVPNEKLQVWSFSNHPNKKTGQMRRMKNGRSGKCIGLRYATDYNGGKAVTEWSCGKAVGQALQLCNDNSKPGCTSVRR